PGFSERTGTVAFFRIASPFNAFLRRKVTPCFFGAASGVVSRWRNRRISAGNGQVAATIWVGDRVS
ncbi:MAG: hypothetical protein V3T77_00150, partial [Planctomycetota bacterium]